MPKTRKKQQGAALVLTLVTITIVAALAAGIGTLVISHYNRVTKDQDAAKALNYAESALNFQVQKLSVAVATTSGTIPDSRLLFGVPDSPLVVANATPGSPGPMNAYLPLSATGDVCTAWVTVPLVAGAYKFDPYSTDYEIYGRATVNGITRYVRAKAGGGKGIFDDWAVFGDKGVEIIGNMDVIGVVGSNGIIKIDGNASSTSQALYGGGVAVADPDFPASYFPSPIVLPTITQIANQISGAATGIEYFRTSNDNAVLGRYQGNKALPTAGVKVDKEEIVLLGKTGGANFFLDNLDNKVDIRADISAGPVNLWVSTNKAEKINAQSSIRAAKGTASPTLEDAKHFHIYYRNKNSIELNGGTNFYAMFYAIDQEVIGNPSSQRIGRADMNGGTDFHGAVMATEITKSNGNAQVIFPTNPGFSSGEGIVYYGIKQPWVEYNPVRGNS